MRDVNTTKHARYDRALAELEMAVQSGRIADPLIQEYWRRGLSPLGNGEHGAKAQAILENMLTGPAILAGLSSPTEPSEPDVDPKNMILIGWRRALRRMTGVLRRLFTTHLLIQGPTGTGKTNLIWFIVRQLIELGLKVVFHDHKNEGRKLLRRYPGVVVLRISDFRENFLKPIGDPKQYLTTFWSELGRAYRLRRETVVKVTGISLRVVAGLRPEDPYPSLYDFACMLRRMSKSEGDSTLSTAATALESLVETMGKAATVREGPCADDLFNVVVVQCHGLPHEFLHFFMGIRLFRTHLKAIARGHTGELTSVIISDEGGIEFQKEPAGEYVHISNPQRRLITQFRSTGTGVIIATQSISAIDPAVIANVGSFVCLKAQSDPDVRLSGRLLGLSEDKLDQVRSVPRWSGLFKSPSHAGPVLVEIPEVDMGDYMSDAELDSLNQSGLDRLDSQAIFAPVHEEAAAPISYRDILGETPCGRQDVANSDCSLDITADHMSFIREVLAHPEACVVEHYTSIGWGVGRGNRIKSDLMDNGILESERQTSRNGRPIERLIVTEKGRKTLDEQHQT